MALTRRDMAHITTMKMRAESNVRTYKRARDSRWVFLCLCEGVLGEGCEGLECVQLIWVTTKLPGEGGETGAWSGRESMHMDEGEVGKEK